MKVKSWHGLMSAIVIEDRIEFDFDNHYFRNELFNAKESIQFLGVIYTSLLSKELIGVKKNGEET